MLSNIGDTSMIPITVVCTDKFDDFQQENYVLKSWLERFRFDYEYLYKSQSKTYSFSQPSIILIDDHRETPLNNSLLQFFNHETFKEVCIHSPPPPPSKKNKQTYRIFLVHHSNLFLRTEQLPIYSSC